MNKNLMIAGMLGMGMFALVGCDQDESCDDNWNGKVRTSLAARARTFSNENNDEKPGGKLLCLLPGSGSFSKSYGERNQATFKVDYSWNGGFTFSTSDLIISPSVSTSNPNCLCSLEGWQVTGKMLTTNSVRFICQGSIVCNDTVKKESNSYKIYEEVFDNVQCIEKDPME